MKVGIVCGYGIILDERLKAYLHAVVEYTAAHQIHTLILSGGHTVQGAEETEAQVMCELIRKKNQDLDLVLEEQSITTLHNLLYSKHTLDTFNCVIDTLDIFCDSARFMKVSCLAKILFRDHVVNVVRFERREPALLYLMQIPFTIVQCLGAIFPSVEKKILTSRQRWMNK